MAEFTTPQFWLAVVAIMFVNILLSGDNAIVIALACRNLSPRARRQGIFWGVLGAIVLRIALTFFVMSLLVDPWLKLVGGRIAGLDRRQAHRRRDKQRAPGHCEQ